MLIVLWSADCMFLDQFKARHLNTLISRWMYIILFPMFQWDVNYCHSVSECFHVCMLEKKWLPNNLTLNSVAIDKRRVFSRDNSKYERKRKKSMLGDVNHIPTRAFEPIDIFYCAQEVLIHLAVKHYIFILPKNI